MSPFAHLLYQTRIAKDLRQSELAELLGFDQSYISALEISTKGPPSKAFVDKLCEALALSPDEQAAIRDAADASQREYVLPPDARRETFLMWKELRDRINDLHPAEIQIMRDILALRSRLAAPANEPRRQLRRRKAAEQPDKGSTDAASRRDETSSASTEEHLKPGLT